MQAVSVDACIELLDRENLRGPVLARMEKRSKNALRCGCAAARMWSLFCLRQNTAFWRSRPERRRCAKG